MYAFALELKPKVVRSDVWEAWHHRIEREYRQRKPSAFILVRHLLDNVYRVEFTDEDYNFNWCFSVSDDLTLIALEITIEDTVIPTTHSGEPDADGRCLAFPDAASFPGLYCELTMNNKKRWIKVRTTLTDEYHWNDYRRGMMEVVQGVISLGRMTKWTMRMIKGFRENNHGLALRAEHELYKAIALSAPFITST